MDDRRPDPDALLAQVTATERRQHRERLKVSLGAAAGSGRLPGQGVGRWSIAEGLREAEARKPALRMRQREQDPVEPFVLGTSSSISCLAE